VVYPGGILIVAVGVAVLILKVLLGVLALVVGVRVRVEDAW
jgi:hypothetical protein